MELVKTAGLITLCVFTENKSMRSDVRHKARWEKKGTVKGKGTPTGKGKAEMKGKNTGTGT